MNLRKLLVVSLATAGLLSVESATAAGWYSGAIEQVEVTSTGEVMAFLQGPANHECGSKRVDYMNGADAHSKSFLAALLAWQAQGKSVRVYIVSCEGTAGLISAAVNEI